MPDKPTVLLTNPIHADGEAILEEALGKLREKRALVKAALEAATRG